MPLRASESIYRGNKKSPFGKALFRNYDFGAETGNLFREEDFYNKWKNSPQRSIHFNTDMFVLSSIFL